LAEAKKDFIKCMRQMNSAAAG